MTDLEHEIKETLDRLDQHLPASHGQRSRRRATVRKVAELTAAGESYVDFLKSAERGKDIISYRIWIDADKPYAHDPAVAFAVRQIADLIQSDQAWRRWEEQEVERERRRRGRIALIDSAKGKLEEIIAEMNTEKTTAHSVATMFRAVLGEERTEFEDGPDVLTEKISKVLMPSLNGDELDMLIQGERIEKVLEHLLDRL